MTVNILQIFSKVVTVCEGSLLQNTACNQRTLRGDMACCKKCYEAILFYLKGKVHSKRKLLSSFTHSCVSQKTLDYFSSKEHKKQYFEKNRFVHIMSISQCSSKCIFHIRKKCIQVQKSFLLTIPLKKHLYLN